MIVFTQSKMFCWAGVILILWFGLIIQQRLTCRGFMSENATLWTSGSGSKFLMGSGTKLIVQHNKEVDPVYYKFNDSCLATDFTNYTAVKFQDVTPVRYSGRSYYSSFSFSTSEYCEQKACQQGSSSGNFESGKYEKTNYMSLGLYWLRILFLKTVVFNVLMTFKAWMN
ncbi:M1-specific T cell receptor alpha chain-like [Carassius carassius]|uniref:M1-specific T cell receptor alpha chain-like n=1 Tax=Carassius carassius TaxID=217509 RepID=UPI0028687F8B|nr:M1-specific T cell receptor alpha chain-like [Carassius carassius]